MIQIMPLIHRLAHITVSLYTIYICTILASITAQGFQVNICHFFFLQFLSYPKWITSTSVWPWCSFLLFWAVSVFYWVIFLSRPAWATIYLFYCFSPCFSFPLGKLCFKSIHSALLGQWCARVRLISSRWYLVPMRFISKCLFVCLLLSMQYACNMKKSPRFSFGAKNTFLVYLPYLLNH